MATVKEHYKELLSEHYTWMYGGFDNKVKENKAFFENHQIKSVGNSQALDLGSGSGFQSLALAALGFKVTAIDISQELLDELIDKVEGHDVTCVNDELQKFKNYCVEQPELIVCMGDTLTHLESKEDISTLVTDVSEQLAGGGKVVLSFRDLMFEFKDQDRFLPVRSDDNRIFTCFLEYEEERIKVHDLIYIKEDHQWNFKKSFYYKTRIPFEWITEQIKQARMEIVYSNNEKGMITIIAEKQVV